MLVYETQAFMIPETRLLDQNLLFHSKGVGEIYPELRSESAMYSCIRSFELIGVGWFVAQLFDESESSTSPTPAYSE